MSEPNPPLGSASTRRVVWVGSVIIVVLSLIGFVAGLRRQVDDPGYGAGSAEASAEVTRAPNYSQLLERGPVRAWEGSGGIRAAVDKSREQGALEGVGEDQTLPEAIAARMALRAYDGAPPVIPHAVDPRGLPCLSCHEQGGVIAGRVAPAMSHPPLTSCTQCHAPVTGGGPPQIAGLEPAVGESTFVGLTPPTGGERAWPGAPPTIPHPTFMRETCKSCHGQMGEGGLKTSHPWRQSCTQCHAPSAALNQQPVAALPGVGSKP